MAGTSQREIVVNHNHDNEMWTLKSKTNNNTQYTNEINRERSSKSLDGYNTRDSILGNVLTWSDRPESDEQKRHKTEHKTIKKNTNHYSDLAAATKCCGKKKTNDGSTRKSVFQNLDQRAHNHERLFPSRVRSLPPSLSCRVASIHFIIPQHSAFPDKTRPPGLARRKNTAWANKTQNMTGRNAKT